MDVVGRLPPAHAQAAAKVGDEDANPGINYKVMGDPAVASVMRSEHDLLPEQSKQEGRGEVPLGVKRGQEQTKEKGVAKELDEVILIVAGVKAFRVYALMEGVKLGGDAALDHGVGRRVVGETTIDFGLHGV